MSRWKIESKAFAVELKKRWRRWRRWRWRWRWRSRRSKIEKSLKCKMNKKQTLDREKEEEKDKGQMSFSPRPVECSTSGSKQKWRENQCWTFILARVLFFEFEKKGGVKERKKSFWKLQWVFKLKIEKKSCDRKMSKRLRLTFRRGSSLGLKQV